MLASAFHQFRLCKLKNWRKKMNYNFARWQTARAGKLMHAALLAGCVLGMVTLADAQNTKRPTTPAEITPPAGNSALLLGRGVGTQGYVCLPTPTGASWTVNGARPEATLFETFFGQDFQIITHFLSPNTNPNQAAPNPLPFANATWQSSLDSSKVWAQTVHSIAAGTDPSCPNDGAIGCLLLQSIGTQPGPTGGKGMTKITFIQRLNTRGGLAPADGCSTAADVGHQRLVPYSADYFFFHKDN
jgi:Protein of unknown function (DUF3455)